MPTGKPLTSKTASCYFVSQSTHFVQRTGIEMELQAALWLISADGRCFGGSHQQARRMGMPQSATRRPTFTAPSTRRASYETIEFANPIAKVGKVANSVI